MFMAVLCFIYLILSLRTNLVFFLIFLFLVPSFCLLAAAYWHLAQGNAELANTLTITAGATTFVVDILGWYIFSAIMLASLDFPFQLPVVDLSRFVKGASDLQKNKAYSA
jgi:succinate-acetate transporter protein